jgi:Flp pilus assembly protein CpaB
MARSGTSPLADLGRLVSWHRRKLAVLAAMGAAAAGITAATPEPPPSTTVVVAARQLSGGERLTAEDVATREIPTAVLPADALTEAAAVIGRTLVAPLSRGSVLTSISLLGARPEVGDGLVIAPLRIADAAVVGLLRVGDRVDVVATDPETGRSAEVVAEQVRVVTIPKAAEDGSALDPGTGAPPTLVLVAVTVDQATQLADAAAGSQISLLLRS